MAQAKVTDYYTRRKHSSSLQPTKRSARIQKLGDNEITPAKCSRKTAVLPETLPVKTAALGTSLVSRGGEVDLSNQLRAFNESKSEANSALVSSILTRTFTGTTVQDKKRSKNVVPLPESSSSSLPTETKKERVLEKTPLKRQVSDPEKGDPPRRKRTKINLQQDSEKTEIPRTPGTGRSSKKRTNAASIRRRLEPTSSTIDSSKSAGSKKFEDIDPNQMKETLLGCGKLADLQARLALVKDTAAEIKRLQATKKTVSKPVPKIAEKESAPTVVPAFERYRHLIQAGPSSLALPFRYRSLEDVFRCSDTVVSMLHNRSENCTFSKLKGGVQAMSRKNFDLSHLKQIKTVYPSAYDMHWTKKESQQKKDEESSTHQLILEADLAGIPTGEPKDEDGAKGSMMKDLMQGDKKNQAGSSRMFDKFTPSMLIARRTLFHNGLVDIVKSHHTEYLASLNPPITSIPDEKLHRWHPKFPLEKIPEVPASDLPAPPKVSTFNTARDVLDKARQMMVNPKVTKALELVAKNSELKAAVEAKRAEDAKKKDVTPQPKKGNQALKGVSQDLLSRIKAKEARNTVITMMRTPEEEGRIGMLERLPVLCKILRVFFLAEKKAALPIDSIIQKLMESYRSALSRDDLEKHIALMLEILPDWLKKVIIRKTTYIKMDRTKEMSVVIDIINNQLKEAKKV
ncbi:DNA replication factor Cdt1 [Strongylocentrotus purpuratus]|uniref:CDT1 Geminin-binding domain-containing protein n=1 Tax=Strongylocentrotus purpuratus TaxID=7668 RepID=A0A7M7STU1_STRPU|nr:DNA replication factor Cdt1 [Strongylocentrotus purpuratus]